MPFLAAILLFGQAAADVDVRNQIVGAYQRSLDALARGDADAALQMDTDDWIGVTVGQRPRSKKEMEPFIRRDIASLKPPAGWVAFWKPDYERNGTASGIQVYDLKVDGDTAVALCLVGSTRTETVDGASHRVWTGSHVRDTWIRTEKGWKRRRHEKLTVDERLVDGKPH